MLKYQDKSLEDIFKAAIGAGDLKDFEIALRAERTDHLGEKFRRFARQLLHRDDLTDNVLSLKVSGRSKITERTEIIDLLRDQLISQQEIVLESPESRALDSDSAYKAVSRAYTELHDQIVAASGLSID